MTTHPTHEDLARAAAGDPEARRSLAPHLTVCVTCREELAHLLGVLEAAAEELIESRPGCPAPEVLAELPPGAEREDPHVRSCPLCREELELLRHLETARTLETALGSGVSRRPSWTQREELELAAAAPGMRTEMELREGASLETTVAGATVHLAVSGGVLTVEVRGEPARPLELVLETDLLERRVALGPGETSVDAGRWGKASVRPHGNGRS